MAVRVEMPTRTPERPDRCGTCRHFYREFKSHGECHIGRPVVGPNLRGVAVTVWPRVSAENWCGEWAPAADTDAPTVVEGGAP